MIHQRTLIRNKIQSLLQNKLPYINENVFISHFSKLDYSDLPCVNIVSAGETREDISVYNFKRTYSVNIEILFLATDEIENKIDNVADEIEHILLSDFAFDGVAKCWDLKSTSQPQINDDTDNMTVAVVLTFEFVYEQEMPNSRNFSQDIADFSAIHGTFKNDLSFDNQL